MRPPESPDQMLIDAQELNQNNRVVAGLGPLLGCWLS